MILNVAFEHARAAVRAMRGKPVVPADCEERVAAANLRWAWRYGLVRDEIAAGRFTDIRCASFAAHTYRRAPEPLVALGADLIAWLFLFDDAFGESAPSTDEPGAADPFESYCHSLRAGAAPAEATAFHGALLDLRARCLIYADHAWLERLAGSFGRYFEGCRREAPFRSARRPPGLAEYRAIRALSIGAYPVFDLIEIANGGVLSPADAESGALADARTRAALLCAWVNDVLSFPKECRDGDPLNLVQVLASERGLALGDAFSAAADVFNEDLAAFEDGLRALDEDPSDRGRRSYASGLEDWVHGNWSWTVLSGRYERR